MWNQTVSIKSIKNYDIYYIFNYITNLIAMHEIVTLGRNLIWQRAYMYTMVLTNNKIFK